MSLIKPASEMSFDDDCLQINGFADQLEKYLQVDHLFVPGSLVVGLEAPFGSGKTAFLAMWTKRMRENLSSGSDGPIPVLLNAWEDDFVGDPLLSIMLSLVSEIEQHKVASVSDLSGLKRAAKQVAWFGVGLANSFVRGATTVDVVAAGKLAEEKSGKQETKTLEVFDLYLAKKQSLADLKNELKGLFGSDDHVKAIVCIDELDRCRPDYAIQYLETIKHVFDIPGIVFVLAIDKDQVANSAKSLFGSELNANEYLRKFMSRSFHLPKPNENGIRSLVQSFYKRFMVVENVRDSEFKEPYLQKCSQELCVEFNFTLRQIEDLFRLMGHVFAAEKPSGRIYSSWTQAYLFLCCLKIHESNFYYAFCRGAVGMPELIKLLTGKMSDRDIERWACLCYTGMNLEREAEGFYEHLKRKGLRNKDSSELESGLEQHWIQNWGHSYGNCIRRIFDNIESASSISK